MVFLAAPRGLPAKDPAAAAKPPPKVHLWPAWTARLRPYTCSHPGAPTAPLLLSSSRCAFGPPGRAQSASYPGTPTPSPLSPLPPAAPAPQGGKGKEKTKKKGSGGGYKKGLLSDDADRQLSPAGLPHGRLEPLLNDR